MSAHTDRKNRANEVIHFGQAGHESCLPPITSILFRAKIIENLGRDKRQIGDSVFEDSILECVLKNAIGLLGWLTPIIGSIAGCGAPNLEVSTRRGIPTSQREAQVLVWATKVLLKIAIHF